MNKAGR